MNFQIKQQEKIREILRKYIADDGLKLKYNGITAWEIAGMILREVERLKDEEETTRDFEGQEAEERYLEDSTIK